MMIEITDTQALQNEIDMLKGNINRMAVTDDKEELDVMKQFALMRIEAIYEYRYISL